ncbi:hypothetical protein [Candidatus Methanoperedens nitratireducens]|uniref:Uncharacterized protein n=1 Tax=Candidatus Methanoperedens nitratireducens TaxID=1392998 RepID=A0A284VK76_9EURY|nr:hypothetical protein [Candidatus Methanoperedens nitroreducens]SNQ59684.1 hypothetical protein MNV_1270014 [Candidatus Methanoperedens nitroreducens]
MEENDQFNPVYFLKKAFLEQIAIRYFIIGPLPGCHPLVLWRYLVW